MTLRQHLEAMRAFPHAVPQTGQPGSWKPFWAITQMHEHVEAMITLLGESEAQLRKLDERLHGYSATKLTADGWQRVDPADINPADGGDAK